eukprot:COSAG06_NODE_3_length_43832_cov_136.908399_6_plen_79_part_00
MFVPSLSWQLIFIHTLVAINNSTAIRFCGQSQAPMAGSVHVGHAQPPKLSRSQAGSIAVLDLHGVAGACILPPNKKSL